MKQTVADLMMGLPKKDYPDNAVAVGMTQRLRYPTEIRVFTLSLILDPSEVEILDQKVVIEKRIIAGNRDEAINKFGIIFIS